MSKVINYQQLEEELNNNPRSLQQTIRKSVLADLDRRGITDPAVIMDAISRVKPILSYYYTWHDGVVMQNPGFLVSKLGDNQHVFRGDFAICTAAENMFAVLEGLDFVFLTLEGHEKEIHLVEIDNFENIFAYITSETKVPNENPAALEELENELDTYRKENLLWRP